MINLDFKYGKILFPYLLQKVKYYFIYRNNIRKSKWLLLAFLFFITTVNGQTIKSRPLNELINIKESAWTSFLQTWIKEAKNEVQVLPKDDKKADSALYKAQVTTRSPMGSIIYETGGILIDKGWIRILGSGSKKLDRN
ncbi:MAG: DUF2625 family protein, partial [Bacteroidia bacterium]